MALQTLIFYLMFSARY